MLTSERSLQSSGIITAAMPETQDIDMTSWSEADFEEKCTYIVKDQPLEEEPQNSSRTRAERSLPRNLALKRCLSSSEVGSKAELPCLCVIQMVSGFKELLPSRKTMQKISP